MFKKSLMALSFIAFTSPAISATLSSVACNPVAVTMVFSASVNDATNPSLISLGESRDGPFTALSSDSTISIEQDTTITVVLSDSDQAGLASAVTSSTCTVKVDPAFASTISSIQTTQQ